MRRPTAGTVALLACSLLVVGAMGVLTARLLELERTESEARSAADRQEILRLALWRLDSAVAPLLAREAARPYFHYRSFHPTDRAYTRMLETIREGDVLVHSPLIDAPDPFIQLHFQIDPSGEISSPQVPADGLRTLAEATMVSPASIIDAEDRLSRLAAMLSSRVDGEATSVAGSGSPDREVPGASGRGEVSVASSSSTPVESNAPSRVADLERGEDHAAGAPTPTESGIDAARRPSVSAASEQAVANDYRARQQSVQVAQSNQVPGVGDQPPSPRGGHARTLEKHTPGVKPSDVRTREDVEVTAEDRATSAALSADKTRSETSAAVAGESESFDAGRAVEAMSDRRVDDPSSGLKRSAAEAIRVGVFAPRWVGSARAPELIFSRVVEVGSDRFEQGFWLDWPLTRSWLLAGVGDLAPSADLRPSFLDPRELSADAMGRTLASIPVELSLPRVDLSRSGVEANSPDTWAFWGLSPIRAALLGAWVALLAALGLSWYTFRAVHDLAERRGRFAAAVSHELRTPITTFCMYSQMLAEDMVPAERRGEYLGTIRDESKRLAGIIESVLRYAKVGRAGGATSVRPIALGATLSGIVERLGPRAAERGFEIACDSSGLATASDGSPVLALADPESLERIIDNLVDNACKYAREHEPRRIEIAARAEDRRAVITVRDHGPGLTREERRHAFEPYFRGERATDLGVHGLGLGLALAKSAAEGMGATLRIGKVERGGRGTAFEITLVKSGQR